MPATAFAVRYLLPSDVEALERSMARSPVREPIAVDYGDGETLAWMPGKSGAWRVVYKSPTEVKFLVHVEPRTLTAAADPLGHLLAAVRAEAARLRRLS